SYIPHAQEKTPDQWNELRKTITIDNVPLYKHGFWNLLLKKIRMEDYHYIQETQGFSTIISNWNGAEAFAWFSREFQPNQQYHTLKPGMSELPEKLAHAFEKEGGTLKLSHSVEKISLDHTKKNSYYVLSIKDSSQKIYAKKLILALPKRAIQIVQEKSPLLQQAQFTQDLASVEAERGSKLYLAYDWPWWTDLGLTYGNGITDLPLRQFFYFNHQKPLTKKKNNPSLLMAGYNDGTSVDFWNGFTQPSDPPLFAPKLLIDEAQRQLKKIHQYSIPQPYYAIFHDWVNDPYGGAWHFWNPGIKTWEVMPRIQQPFAKQALYICGEAYSVTQGWIEGALETAELLLKEKFGLKPPAWLSKKSATC
ncbi:MAG: FAD-dependent oxidoreductase, partial [Candidatus Babeliales bacterium]